MTNSKKSDDDYSEEANSEESGMMEHIIQSHISMAMLLCRLAWLENDRSNECIACKSKTKKHDDACEYKLIVDFIKRVNTIVETTE